MKIIGLKITGARLISAIEMEFNDSGLIPKGLEYQPSYALV